ncbi:DNA alkylation repair protein [Rhizobium leguminosarum]|uniref:DNA alkylation repair protein n=1 Tax=Rhizobium leguminosarum TaxID=384 RepID=A0A6P0DA31_RHILE|nr:DNA alkylation repair protein [Rhizobium leguminosarum]ASS57077.1 DNA alkylation repair protein [Rhizobium leguminosarum bv. viciae]AVC50172.1 DNA alkylation repair enzyme family protein [Rhizobium leguminosarum bv. viciae]MBB4329409.1 3-methyladenine DNA glycosylase AlkD [Rhizobium leguminosarum]MBB4343936.1 3-methyladenine DNA glycosylase AlkD [Rhizobium leguminosarum]MBB4355012.1 3-methyladenine DNA glycosylase AlkD [Rhizobium leguminosarum]
MIGPSSDAAELIAHLETLRSEENVAGMARFGIVTDRALGISNPDIRAAAGLAKKDHARAMQLWRSDIREARLLALYTAEPKRLTMEEARSWANDFNSWEIVDCAADLFVEAQLDELISDFAADEREFIRRTAFAMIAGAAVHLKKEPDATILAWLPLIEAHAGDPRNFVRKAVNWALRSIGKRNLTCHAPALTLAKALAESPDKTARWIGKDAVRELAGEKLLARLI